METITPEEIKQALEVMKIVKRVRVKVNEKWLYEQIDDGRVLKGEYEKGPLGPIIPLNAVNFIIDNTIETYEIEEIKE